MINMFSICLKMGLSSSHYGSASFVINIKNKTQNMKSKWFWVVFIVYTFLKDMIWQHYFVLGSINLLHPSKCFYLPTTSTWTTFDPKYISHLFLNNNKEWGKLEGLKSLLGELQWLRKTFVGLKMARWRVPLTPKR